MERTRRRARPALTAALALGAPLAVTAVPAAAAPESLVYDALGDSYAAGFGVPEGQAYPYVLDGRLRITLDDDAAVTGATVASMLATQLDALDDDTDLVTLSIGGNDVPWVDVVVACGIGTDAACAGAIGAVATAIQSGLPGALDLAYTQVRARAPEAHVVVTGYPRLFSPEYGDYTGVFDHPLVGTVPFEVTVAEQHALNQLADMLDATIADHAHVHGAQFVGVTQRFAGHGVNAPEAWVGGLEDPELLHPTVDGQHAYGVALRSQISPGDLR